MGVLDGRVSVVTGAGHGLGRAHVLFAAEGAPVVVNDADASAAHEVVGEITARGGRAVASAESVADWRGARRIVDTAVEAFGDLHVVVNNAGIVRGWSLTEMTEDDVDAVLAVNLKGTLNVTRWAAEYWQRRADTGETADRAIVNTSSGAGLHGNAGQANYAATKAGVAPIARTRLSESMPGVADVLARSAFDPENVSPLVAALAAPACPFTGQVFSVIGGSVGLYAGWSIAAEVTSDSRWSVAGLIEAMDGLPRSVEVNSQLAKVAEAAR